MRLPAALAAQAPAVAYRARDVAGGDSDVVCDVGDQRGVSDKDQRGEGDQRAAARGRVDRPGEEAGGDKQDDDFGAQVHGLHAPLVVGATVATDLVELFGRMGSLRVLDES